MCLHNLREPFNLFHTLLSLYFSNRRKSCFYAGLFSHLQACQCLTACQSKLLKFDQNPRRQYLFKVGTEVKVYIKGVTQVLSTSNHNQLYILDFIKNLIWLGSILYLITYTSHICFFSWPIATANRSMIPEHLILCKQQQVR